MTHKVHPKAYRIKETIDWKSRGFYKDAAKDLEEDFKIREFLLKKLKKTGVEKIEIERFSNKLNIIIFSSRPGIIIGRGGEGVENLKKELLKKVFRFKVGKKGEKSVQQVQNNSVITSNSATKKRKKQPAIDKAPERKGIKVEIREIRNPWISASLCAQWVAQQLERRINHRRALKQAISKTIANKEVKGVKVEVSGRLNGVEIARREWLRKGQLPLQTIRADIDYAKAEANCSYGVIGVKVWIYKGEKFE